MRGRGTWGKEAKNLRKAERQEMRSRRGSGSWGTEAKNLYRVERQRQRQERRNKSLLYKLLG